MALSRIGSSCDALRTVSRLSYAGVPLSEVQCTRYAAAHQSRINGLHLTSIRRYPDPPALPLPTNVSQIFGNETGRFTPERARDIAAPVLLYGQGSAGSSSCDAMKRSCQDRSAIPQIREDTHVDSYDCFGAVSLNGSMQSNVPKPFCSSGKSMHLNMPGGQWARDGKYIAEDMQNSHYRSTRAAQFKLKTDGFTCNVILRSSLLQRTYGPNHVFYMQYSTHNAASENQKQSGKETNETDGKNLTKKEAFKSAVKKFGPLIVVFHISHSLVVLGIFYILVKSGVDMWPFAKNLISKSEDEMRQMLYTSSTFVVAYTLYKCTAPFRIGFTLGAFPFVLKFLRRFGYYRQSLKVSPTEVKKQ